jgi:hypothetical protein
MAKRTNSSKKSESTSKRSPMTPKAGVTRNNNSRRYSCGGKLSKSK